ncbi:MAG: homoserine O-acetyltransferase MetX [Ignavibacteriales bacterium]
MSGGISASTEFLWLFNDDNQLCLENGSTISPVKVAYQTYGKLNSEGTNAILICHALTGNAHAAGTLDNFELDNNSNPDCLQKYSNMQHGKQGWWDGLIGPAKAFDTNKYFIICSNILGSCYGTTGPVSTNPATGKSYRTDFPLITVRDMVKVQYELVKSLGVNSLASVAGGSLGGMQVLEWAVMYPEIVKSIIPMATTARHSDWAIGLNEAARRAIKSDPEWLNGFYLEQPNKGLELARMIAMITYRSYSSFSQKFGRERIKNGRDHYDTQNLFQVQNYLNYQGKKLVERFDANTYLYLSDAMDFHDLGHGRGKLEDVLGTISAKTLSIGINSDVLYPPDEQKLIKESIPGALYSEIDSIYGHDAFLIEYDQLNRFVKDFLQRIC